MKIKFYKLFLVFNLIVNVLFAQGLGGDVFMIKFSDKNGNGFSIQSPEAFLSPRAIQNRQTRGISIIEQDLPINQNYVSQIAATGVTIIGKSKWLNSVAVLVNSPNQLAQIMQLPFVVGNSSLNRTYNLNNGLENKFELEKFYDFSQTQSRNSNISMFDYGNGYGQINMINGIPIHESGYRGQGMLIAVLDAGFPGVDTIPAFDSLRNENRILSTYDFVNRNSYVYSYNSHGTSTLSCMASLIPGTMIGTAPKADYLLIRTEDAVPESKSEEFYWVEGAEFADSCGANVISSSLGYTTFDNSSINYSISDLDGNTSICTRGADIAASKGILVVNSAGNSGGNSWQKLGTPSDGDSVFCIGGVDANLVRASFSSLGPTADGRIKPDVAAQAVSAMVYFDNGSLGGANGTSFSCPIIAGMSACLWQANPTYSNMQLIEAIKNSSNQAMNPDTLLGWGVPNFSAANLILQGKNLDNFPTFDKFLVGPNPFSNEVFVNFYSADTQSLKINIVDCMGKLIFEKNYFANQNSYNQYMIPIAANISNGIYLLSISNKEGIIKTKKIIKN